jgi:hypothetical protein
LGKSTSKARGDQISPICPLYWQFVKLRYKKALITCGRRVSFEEAENFVLFWMARLKRNSLEQFDTPPDKDLLNLRIPGQ